MATLETSKNYLHMGKSLKAIFDSIANNANRMQTMLIVLQPLLNQQSGQSDSKGKKIEVIEEVLRAQIVFLHAIFEDSLRELIRLKIEFDLKSTDFLKNIPLVGSGQPKRPSKFGLDDLVPHQNKTVSQLIKESVDEYLDTYSFSSSAHVSSLLLSLGLSIDDLRIYFSDLDCLMSRRHQIVHKADRVGGINNSSRSSVDPAEFTRWMFAVHLFVFDVAFKIVPDEIRPGLSQTLLNNSSFGTLYEKKELFLK